MLPENVPCRKRFTAPLTLGLSVFSAGKHPSAGQKFLENRTPRLYCNAAVACKKIRGKTMTVGVLNIISRMSRMVILSAAVCFIPLLCAAQEFHGSLRGTVQDASGARIPSATIVLHAAESSMEIDTVS